MSGARGKLIVYMCSLIESRNYAAENHCEQIKKFTEIMLEKVRQFALNMSWTKRSVNILFWLLPHTILGKYLSQIKFSTNRADLPMMNLW